MAEATIDKVRRSLRWPKAARDLVRENLNARGPELRALIATLARETGYPRSACRRFARTMGISPMRVQKSWTVTDQQRLIKLLDLHPVSEIGKLMHRSRSSIWHMLYRLGANAKMGKDSFTKYTLASLLQVRVDTVEQLIQRGWLKCGQLESGRTIIEAADFCEFCKLHTRDVVGNRLRKERLEFVYHFAFPGSHSELLPVRQSKKERGAYDAQARDNSGHAAEAISDGQFETGTDETSHRI